MSDKNQDSKPKSEETLTDDVEKLETELLEAQEAVEDYKKQLDIVNAENSELSKRVKELEAKLEASKKTAELSRKSTVIMDAKKLDPKKKYVTGPSGKGYVEA